MKLTQRQKEGLAGIQANVAIQIRSLTSGLIHEYPEARDQLMKIYRLADGLHNIPDESVREEVDVDALRLYISCLGKEYQELYMNRLDEILSSKED